jgi:hypothetical protein
MGLRQLRPAGPPPGRYSFPHAGIGLGRHPAPWSSYAGPPSGAPVLLPLGRFLCRAATPLGRDSAKLGLQAIGRLARNELPPGRESLPGNEAGASSSFGRIAPARSILSRYSSAISANSVSRDIDTPTPSTSCAPGQRSSFLARSI